MIRCSPDDRFFAKIDASGECWIWTAARSRDGYGSFGLGAPHHGSVLAHRWAYARFVGPIPDGLCVLHRCDNPPCVNPAHLFIGTQADNVADCAAKGRRNQARYQKLSAGEHAEICERYAQGDVSQGELAQAFGVAQATISAIVRRGGHVPLSPRESGIRRVNLARGTR